MPDFKQNTLRNICNALASQYYLLAFIIPFTARAIVLTQSQAIPTQQTFLWFSRNVNKSEVASWRYLDYTSMTPSNVLSSMTLLPNSLSHCLTFSLDFTFS